MIQSGLKKNRFTYFPFPFMEEAGFIQSEIFSVPRFRFCSLKKDDHSGARLPGCECNPYSKKKSLSDSVLIFHESEKINTDDFMTRQEKTYLSSRIISPAYQSANLSLSFCTYHADACDLYELVLALPIHGKKIDLTGKHIRLPRHLRSIEA